MIRAVKWFGLLNCNIEVGRSRMHLKVGVVYGLVVVDGKPVTVRLALRIEPNRKGGYHRP
jgi:hypothetical protein